MPDIFKKISSISLPRNKLYIYINQQEFRRVPASWSGRWCDRYFCDRKVSIYQNSMTFYTFTKWQCLSNCMRYYQESKIIYGNKHEE